MEKLPPAKVLRLIKMTESLAKMRKDEHGVDVVLVSGGKEFPAHKLVLETSSPYFLSMFSVGMEEAVSGRVVLHSVKPDTLEAILNYIYVGDITNSDTGCEVKMTDMLAAAHMMQLTDLTETCSKALSRLISKANCMALWHLSSLYECRALKTDILNFFLTNIEHLKVTDLFLEMSDGKMQELLRFAVMRQFCLDKILVGVVNWTTHDMTNRLQFLSEIFACLDPAYFSHHFFKMLLRDTKIMSLSPEIANKMNELGIKVLVFSSKSTSRGVLRIVVKNLSKRDHALRSSPRIIQNFAWSIEIIPVKSVGCEPALVISFKVECNYKSEETDWSCKAVVKFRLVNHKDPLHSFTRERPEHLFDSCSPTLGFTKFMKLHEDQPFIFNDCITDDTAIFEAEITTTG